jgi:uncharacterized beta-barrel protein YwiB (DUF1934 family)
MSGLTVSNSEYIPVKVHLKTVITSGDEQDSIEFSAFGRYYEKADSIFLKYDEVQDEGTIRTIVKLSDENALILRSGAVKMRLVFKENEQLNGSYESQIGTLLLLTKTKQLSHKRKNSEKSGEIRLDYQLMMQGSTVGNYEMLITYKEEEETS